MVRTLVLFGADMTVPFQEVVTESRLAGRVALMVDGDNVSADFAGQLITRSLSLGMLAVRRVYGNAALLPKWDAVPGFRLIHAGAGKNATDLLMAIEAMALIHDGLADLLVIASSDRDFSHLASHLHERGITVVGMGEAKAPESFRKACTRFVELGGKAKSTAQKPESAPSQAMPATPEKRLVATVIEVVHKNASETGWMNLANLGHHIKNASGPSLKAAGYTRWKDFLTKFSAQFELDASGTTSRVRLRKP